MRTLTLTCARARRRLQAFHDRELPVSDQIAIAAHLKECPACAQAVAEMELVASTLRAATGRRPALTLDESASFRASVVSRLKAERDASFPARIRSMFEDMHLVYAGFGAAAAALVCVIIMLGMMRFATSERPDSLAAMVAFLATPGSSANVSGVDPEAQARWMARAHAATERDELDAVFMLAAAVTRARDGQIADLPRLRAGRPTAAEEAKAIEGWMDYVSRTRLEPGQGDGAAATRNMVRLITHATVRPSDNPRGLDLALPATKKRATIFTAPPARAILA